MSKEKKETVYKTIEFDKDIFDEFKEIALAVQGDRKTIAYDTYNEALLLYCISQKEKIANDYERIMMKLAPEVQTAFEVATFPIKIKIIREYYQELIP